MKITIMPKSTLGKFAALISIAFFILIFLKMMSLGIPIPTFAIFGIAIIGFILGLIAVIKKDYSLGTIFSLVVGLGIIGLVGFIGISSLGVFKDFPVKEELSAEEAGNIGSTTMNLGNISESGGWVYYVFEDNLYKRKADWSSKTMVSENNVNSIFILEDWIYYTDNQDLSCLYKMKTDGSEQQKVIDENVNSFYVAGDWIFYNTKKSLSEINEAKEKYKEEFLKKTGGGTLSKIKTDGSGKVKVIDTSFEPGAVKVFGDWIYYGDYGNIFRVKTDGTNNNLVAEGAFIGYASGEWVYYTVPWAEGNSAGEKMNIYRVRLDGTEKSGTTVVNGVVNYCFDSGWFYYGIESEKGLFRVKPDGSEKAKLNNVDIWALDGVIGNWMYISDYAGPRFRVKLDGSLGTKIK